MVIIVSGCSEKPEDKSEITALRDRFNQSLPRAIDLVRQKEYIPAGEILRQARTILNSPPYSLSSKRHFYNELKQIRNCIIALVLLNEIEKSNNALEPEEHPVDQEITETEGEMLTIVELCSAILSGRLGDSGKQMDELITISSKQPSSDSKVIFAGYALLNNRELVNERFRKFKPLGFFSYRKFMITKVFFRGAKSPPPPAPKRINYNSEIKAVYDIAMQVKTSDCLLICVLANHLGIVFGDRMVNDWRYGWQHEPIEHRYRKNIDYALLDPWGRFSDAGELRKTMKSRFDYDLFNKYK
jgi:hypothetical protein